MSNLKKHGIRQRRKIKDAFQKAFAGPFYESEDGIQKLKGQYEEIRELTKELLTPTIVDKICESAAVKYPEVLSDGAVRQEPYQQVEEHKTYCNSAKDEAALAAAVPKCLCRYVAIHNQWGLLIQRYGKKQYICIPYI